jgi:hypothetical protein
MKSFIAKVAVIALMIGGGVLALAGTADASHVAVEILGPQQFEVGVPAALQVALRDAETGLPMANAPVTVYTDATFGGVTGEIELGMAVTDERGVAALNYVPRAAGSQQLRIEHLAPGGIEHEATSAAISVAGAPQLYRSASGVRVPGLNVWLIIALVATVWSLLFSVGLRVFSIARANGDGRNDHGTGRAVSADLGGPGA